MEAIKKKMQAMKLEKDNAIDRAEIAEQKARDANLRAEKSEEEVRALQKKIQQIENELDQVQENLTQANTKLEEKEKSLQTVSRCRETIEQAQLETVERDSRAREEASNLGHEDDQWADEMTLMVRLAESCYYH